jgi:hypothetical protein
MTEHLTAAPEEALRTEITDALVAVWIRYAKKSPIDARTEIRDNVVTCVLTDAVSDFDAGVSASQPRNAVAGAFKFTEGSYKSEAAATVEYLTGRRVTAFISSHDLETNAATETFTLERRLFT